MKKIIKIITRKSTIKATISISVTGGFFWISVYTDFYKSLPISIQLGVFLFLAVINILGPPAVDEFSYGKMVERLRAQKRTLDSLMKSSKNEIAELHQLIAKYFNHSIVYRERIVEKLDIDEAFLCVMKSSEGFGGIWNELEEKEMLPFTKVLDGLPGSIRPFERAGLFIIPVKNLDGFNNRDIRKFINKKIIPKVKRERNEFLKKLTKDQRKKVDKFSYKYIAFILRKNSLDYDTENRKFTSAFTEFVISHQAQRTVASITNELTAFITGSDLLLLVDWEAFADDLNDEQRSLISKHKSELYKNFKKKRIQDIRSLSNTNLSALSEIFLSVLKSETTSIKSKNLAEKIIKGAEKTLRILRNAGVQI